MTFDLEDYKRAVRNLRARRRNRRYTEAIYGMSMERFLRHVLTRHDKLHGIGSDTAWEVLLTRKPEKYEKWI
jgi:hypothetical protein